MGLTRNDIINQFSLSAEQAECIGLKENTSIQAGAGSGKTTTLTAAIIYDLLVEEIPPEEISVSTFTRAAAGNLKASIRQKLEENASLIKVEELMIGTIDSISIQIIKENNLESQYGLNLQVANSIQINDLRHLAWEKALEEFSTEELLLFSDFLGSISIKGQSFQNNSKVLYENTSERLEYTLPEPADLKKIAELIGKIEENIPSIQKLLPLTESSDARWSEISNTALKNIKDFPELNELVIKARAYENIFSFQELADLIIRMNKNFQKEYSRLKKENNLLDYLDLNKEALDLLKNSSQVNKYTRVYLDEAQDNSVLQQELIRNMVSESGTIVIIGDIKQSLYSWRDADPEAYKEWSESFSQKTLTDNYRSNSELLSFTNALSSRIDYFKESGYDSMTYPDAKDSKNEKTDLSLYWMVHYKDPEASRAPGGGVPKEKQVRKAAPVILEKLEELGLEDKDLCILCRDNNSVKEYAEAVNQLGYKVDAFYNRSLLKTSAEVRPVISLMELAKDKKDDLALISILSSPLFHIPLSRIQELSESRHLYNNQPEREEKPKLFLFEYIEKLYSQNKLDTDISRFIELFNEFKNSFQSPHTRLRAFLEHTDYFNKLNIIDSTKILSSNIFILLEVVQMIEENYNFSFTTILDKLELYDDTTKNIILTSPRIKIMTFHNAKGLEFPFVVYTDFGNEKNKSAPALAIDGENLGLKNKTVQDLNHFQIEQELKQKETDEFARICYVGMTRAKENLMIIANSWLSSKPGANIPFSCPQNSLLPALGDLLKNNKDFEFLDIDGDFIQKEQIVVITDNTDTNTPAQLRVNFLPVSNKEQVELPEELLKSRAPQIKIINPMSLNKELPMLKDISYSRLASWKECSMRKFLEYELGLSILDDKKDYNPRIFSGVQQKSSREQGIEIHTELEHIDFTSSESVELFISSNDKQIPDNLIKKIQSYPDIKSELEFNLMLNLNENRVCRLVGKFDLFARNKNKALIIDWKTGSGKNMKEAYEIQKLLYAFAALKIKDIDFIEVNVVYIDKEHADKSSSSKYKESDLKSLEKDLTEKIIEIIDALPEPAVKEFDPKICADCVGQEQVCPVSENNYLS